MNWGVRVPGLPGGILSGCCQEPQPQLVFEPRGCLRRGRLVLQRDGAYSQFQIRCVDPGDPFKAFGQTPRRLAGADPEMERYAALCGFARQSLEGGSEGRPGLVVSEVVLRVAVERENEITRTKNFHL